MTAEAKRRLPAFSSTLTPTASAYGIMNVEVDAVLRQYCANSCSPICTSTPKREECGTFPCKRCPKTTV